MTSEEATELLSVVRLGIHGGILPGLALKTVNDLCLSTQPGHLQKAERRVLDPDERDVARADYIRRKLEA
jgi:protein arginine kinase